MGLKYPVLRFSNVPLYNLTCMICTQKCEFIKLQLSFLVRGLIRFTRDTDRH